MLAVSLFIIGASIDQFFPVYLPRPPQWLLVPAGVFPLCLSLYLRATISQQETPNWLELWRRSHQQQAVGNFRVSVEDCWVQTHGQRAGKDYLHKRILDNAKWWGWCALFSGLCLAYVCVWFGLANAAGR